MSVLYTIKEDSATLWCICRDQTYLATRLGMNEAIRQAGQLAREHHRRSGLTVSVEIASREGITLLSRYARSAELDAPAPGIAGRYDPTRRGAMQYEAASVAATVASAAA